MTSRHPRQRPNSLPLHLLFSASVAAVAVATLGTQPAFAQGPADAAGACAKLATLSNFPLAATQITLAKFNAGQRLGEWRRSSRSLPSAGRHQQARRY
jgi:hypothetical protein